MRSELQEEPVAVPRARVLILSMALAPCKEVGGKRFSFLSRYLAERCDEYHVIARCEREDVKDSTAFRGHVHRVRSIPYYPPRRREGLLHKLSEAWLRWICMLDPHVGWVLPATAKGIALCRRHQINLVIVTVPYLSAVMAGMLISRLSKARLVIDYRDPMTVLSRVWPRPFGDLLSRAVERAAVRRAHAVTFCSDIMKKEFLEAFEAIAPARLEVIYNGFLEFESDPKASLGAGRINMVYAGTFYGRRRLAVIAPVLAEMLRAGEIAPQNFRLHLYAELRQDDHGLIDRLGIESLLEVHDQVPYDRIKQVMQAADILFLPSGDDFAYAAPYKFFDYLSVRRPILAIAPVDSTVHRLMQSVDCGEFAVFGDTGSIREAILRLMRGESEYTYRGAEKFLWEKAADSYMNLINQTLAGSERGR